METYEPTRFMAAGSHYDKRAADYAVAFIQALTHTKGRWAGKPFELIDWQEQIIRDLFGTLKPDGYRQFNTAYVEIPKKMGKIDPTFYPVIYGADTEDDWTDEAVWAKANPSLGITVGIDKVRAACESAKQNPAEENSFRQLRLNQWVKQSVRWMPMAAWDACQRDFVPEQLRGRVCYGGLDRAIRCGSGPATESVYDRRGIFFM